MKACHLISKQIALILFTLMGVIHTVQAYNVPASGSSTQTICSGTIYDPGGTGTYSNSCSGYMTINPGTTGCVVHLEGTYYTESSFDYVTIYDGTGTGGTQLCRVSGSGTIDVTSTTGPLTVQFTTDGSVTYDGFILQVSCRGGCTCGGSPYGVQITNGLLGVDVSWVASLDPTVTNYIVEYGLSGFTPGTGTTMVVNGTSCTLMGLTTFATYDIYIYYDCGNDGVVTTETPYVTSFCVPDDNVCIDFSDWANPNIICTYGTFDNPYATIGVVDNGYSQMSSRHTVHYIDELDPRTDNRLHTVPPCELYSVRLGNWNTNYEAESISYDFLVDTTVADILLLKYAAVLEEPGHDPSEQPRFTFELLNQNNQQIDPVCGAADFIASTSLGWNTAANSVLWKDWTNVGADLSAYHGQTVRVRLTTYDCNQGGHYGYAYFTLGCKKRTIVAETCGEMLSNTYTAPAGFNYRWYYESAPNSTLSTDQSISISVGGGHDVLCCWVSFVGDASCGFQLTTSLTARYPLANFDMERDSCSWSYNFTNTSAVSFDGLTPNGFNEPCETAHWDFGDGTTSDQYNPTHDFPGPGTYIVTMVAGLSNDECLDTISYTIDLLSNMPVISGGFDLCEGEFTTLSASGGNTYTWMLGTDTIGTSPTLYIEPDSTTTYLLLSYAADGCLVTISQEIIIRPTSDSTITDEICQGESYRENGFSLPSQLTAGTITPHIVLPNQYGCDSTVTLTLTIKPLPNVNLGKDYNHCFEDMGATALRVPENDCDSYLWNNGQTTQNLSVTEGGEYAVTAVKDGCENESDITIFNICPYNLYLPNAITPTNPDGINDVFCLPTTKGIKDFVIYIYDRFGKLVFTSTDPHFSWDGSIKGKIKTNATYTYRIDIVTDGNEKLVITNILNVF